MAGSDENAGGPPKRYRRSNPGERWWFALLVIPALIATFVVWQGGSGIERQLEEAATSSLRAAGLPGATAEASGRTMTVRVPTGEDQALAREAVSAVPGVGGVKVSLVARDETEAAACASLSSLLADGRALAFSGDSTRLSGAVANELKTIAALLRDCPSAHLSAGGFTDRSSGNALKVSQARAEAVVRNLEAAGIAPARLAAQGFGAAFPVVDGTAKEREANNRVVLELVVK